MVRKIYILPYKHFNLKGQLGEDYYIFEDYTSNFSDLSYNIDLKNKSLTNAMHNIVSSISRLQMENIEPPFFDDTSFLLPDWWFGTERVSKNSIRTKLLSVNDRKPILLFHLLRIQEFFQYLQTKHTNTEFYCYTVE